MHGIAHVGLSEIINSAQIRIARTYRALVVVLKAIRIKIRRTGFKAYYFANGITGTRIFCA